MVVVQTAIMACCDLLTALPTEMLSLLGADGMERPSTCLLAQLLLKVRNSRGGLQTTLARVCCCLANPIRALSSGQWTASSCGLFGCK